MAEGFLGRWSQRKDAVRKGREVAPEPEKSVAPAPSPQPSPARESGSESGEELAVPPSPPRGEGRGEGRPEQIPPPTLEEAQSLTPESDFTRFARRDVDPQVKNAALKKLFTDPHFNVMDGLDVYIDDYGKPDPLPPEMAKQLASAQFLRLFEEKKEEQPPAPEVQPPTGREAADAPVDESVAQSGTRTAQALPPAEHHADPDLRLQQDDAPGPAGPGAGAG